MSLSGVTRKDQFLTNLALAYPTGSMIGKIVAPFRTGVRAADTVFSDADDSINLVNDIAENTPSNHINFQVGSGYAYKTKRRALDTVILDKTVANEEKVVKSRVRETKKLTKRLLLKHEYNVAAVLTSGSKVTQTAALTGTDQLNNAAYANTFFSAKINTALTTIRTNSGCIANTIIIPWECAPYLAADTGITGKLQYQYGREIVEWDFQQRAQQFAGLPPFLKGLRVIIADARMNNANEGETASKINVWSDNICIGYVPVDPDEDCFGVLTMEYSPFEIYEERQTNPRGTKIIAEWDYDILEADLTTWYLYSDCLA